MNDKRDDKPTRTTDLVKKFWRDPEPFLTAESSRATPLGQVWCECKNPTHSHHERPDFCGSDVFNEGLCRECYALVRGSTSADDL